MTRIFATVLAFAIILLVAGLTHLVAILILPDVATKTAFTLLVPQATGDHVTLLPPSRPGAASIPFRDPATVQGICLYDVTAAPVRVRVQTQEEQLLTLSFRTPGGRIFYSMTDRAALHDKIDIRLVTDAQLKEVEASDDEDQGLPEELRLKAPTARGLVVATVLVARPEDAEAARARIEAITCAPEPLPPPS